MTDVSSKELENHIEKAARDVVRDGFIPGNLVVVTGCARGFGKAIARRLASEGARLAVWDIIEDEGQATAELCRSAGAKEVNFFQCDMSDPDAVKRTAGRVLDAAGTPFALINNAGINPRTPAIDHPVEMFRKTLDVNVLGTFVCAQAFAKAMIEKKRGRIINLASGRAIQGAVNSVSYGASKGAIVNLTKTLASEWGQYGIRINAIIPGASLTRQPLEAGGTLEDLLESGKAVPLGRIGFAEDVAGMVVVLLSRDTDYVTGQSIAINGGKIMLP